MASHSIPAATLQENTPMRMFEEEPLQDLSPVRLEHATQSQGAQKRLNRQALHTIQPEDESRAETADDRSIEFNRIAIGASPEPYFRTKRSFATPWPSKHTHRD